MMSNSTDEIAPPTAENEKCTTDAPTKKVKVNDCKLVSITLPNEGPLGLGLLEKDGGTSVVIDEVIPQSQAEKYGVLAGDIPIYNQSISYHQGYISYDIFLQRAISYDIFLQRARDKRPFTFSVLRCGINKDKSTNQSSIIKEAAAPSRELKLDGTCEPTKNIMDLVHEGIAINDANICAQERTGRWSKEEHDVFLSALQLYGKDWKKIAADIKTRTVVQTRTHAQKYFMKLLKKLNEEEENIELEVYMKRWISNLGDAWHLMPSSSQKYQIVLETKIGIKRLDDWLNRAREKLMKYNEENQVKGRLNAAAVATIVTSSQPPAYGGSISTVATVSETSTPSDHSVTASTNNSAITPGSSMKIPKKSSLRDSITPPKRFVARPSKFGLKKVDGDKAAAASTNNIQTPRHGAVPAQPSTHTQCLPKTAAYQKSNTPVKNNEQKELDQVALDSSIAVQTDTQVVSIDTISNPSDDEPYIGSRCPSSFEQSPRVVSSTDYYPGCNLKGAHPLPGSNKYKSIIFYEGSRYSLGKYEFVSDAALAYDKAALSIGPYWDINFGSWDEYIATRTLEVMKKGSDQVDLTSVLEEISSRASEVMSKVVDEAELNDFEWIQQSLGSTASDSHDERVKAYENARALYLSMKEEEYHVQEKVYAWDRGALYEAKILKCKETDDGTPGRQYFIHYLGYKSCHDKWLSPKDMMKLNPSNKRFYCQSRGILYVENEAISNEDVSIATLQDHVEEDDGNSVIGSWCCRTDSYDSEEDDTSSGSPDDCSDSEIRISRKRKLPTGVHESISGNYQVQVYYQGNNRNTAEECERNFKLAKEAAWTDSSDVKRGRGRPMKATQTVHEEKTSSNDISIVHREAAKLGLERRKKKQKNDLPKGVYELPSGSWRVQVYYQGSHRGIGTFQTLEQATMANEIARNMLKKDKGLQLSAEECERNFKLAKEAAWTDSSDVKCSSGLQKKAKRTVYEEETVIRDSSKEEPRENRDGGLSRHGRKRKMSKKKVDSLDIDEEMSSISYCQPASTKRKRAGRPRSTKSASVSVVRDYRLCSIAGCTKHAQKGGVCCLHGGKVTRRLCTYKGSWIGADGQCPNVVKRGGLCRRHGAFDLPYCSDPFCKRFAQKGDDYCTLHKEQERRKRENEKEQDDENENEGEPMPVCPIALEEKEKEDSISNQGEEDEDVPETQ